MIDVTTLRARIAAAPTTADVDAVMRDVWAALGNGIDETEAETLNRLAQDRRGRPGWRPDTAKHLAPPRRLGSTPRTPESIERRRAWVLEGWVPKEIGTHYTFAAVAVLAVVAAEIANKGRCDLPISAIAGKAGVGDTTARDALRRARHLGHIQSIEHRISYDRSEPNEVRILHRGWSRWLARPRRSVPPGVGRPTPTNTRIISRTGFLPYDTGKMVAGGSGRHLWRALSPPR